MNGLRRYYLIDLDELILLLVLVLFVGIVDYLMGLLLVVKSYLLTLLI